MKNSFEELYKIVRENEKKGLVTVWSVDGLVSAPIEEVVKQPVKGLLYDLNRDKDTTLALGKEGNVRWLNDYAVAVIIEHLCNKLGNE